MMALDFIAQRESGKPPKELCLWREKRANGETQYELAIQAVIRAALIIF
jgi:hypothetical protein